MFFFFFSFGHPDDGSCLYCFDFSLKQALRKKSQTPGAAPIALLILLFSPVSCRDCCENLRWYMVGFCQPRNPNEALPIRLDLSNMYSIGAAWAFCPLFRPCNIPSATIQQLQTEKNRYASFYRTVLRFHHTENCQNISNTFIL